MKRTSKDEAQKILDERNGNFLIIDYNGMRNHSTVMCLNCNSQFDVSIDSLLRKNSRCFGCAKCNFEMVNNKLLNNSLEFISRNEDNTVNVKCLNCGSVFSNRISLFTNPYFLCKNCTEARTSKIINNQHRYSPETIKRTKIDWNIRCLIDTNSLEWYYILGLFMADGSFCPSKNRVRLRLKNSDKEIIYKISDILECDVIEKEDISSIDFCSGVIGDIIKKYSISNIKTYEPCDIASLQGQEMIAFFIGFVDGDGYIGYRSDNKKPQITIKLHSSWCENLNYISRNIYKYFGIEKSPSAVIVKYKNKEYAQISFSNQELLKCLFNFINENSIPFLERKWSKLEVI